MPHLIQSCDLDALAPPRAAPVRLLARLLNANSGLPVTNGEPVVSLDRDHLSNPGVPARDTATTPRAPLGGRDVRRFTSNSWLYDVVLHLDPAHPFTSAVDTTLPMGLETGVEDRMRRGSSITMIDSLVQRIGERAHLEAM